MNIAELFPMQKKFDGVVVEKHGLEGQNLLSHKIIALDVELSEFANEVRFFKYWSKKKMNRERALEEFVDSLHFFLSIGNDLGVRRYEDYEENVEIKGDALVQYHKIKSWLYRMESPVHWYIAFGLFRGLGVMLGFEDEEIVIAYKKKHKINYERQANDY